MCVVSFEKRPQFFKCQVEKIENDDVIKSFSKTFANRYFSFGGGRKTPFSHTHSLISHRNLLHAHPILQSISIFKLANELYRNFVFSRLPHGMAFISFEMKAKKYNFIKIMFCNMSVTQITDWSLEKSTSFFF